MRTAFLTLPLLFIACGILGSVDTDVVSGLLLPVTARVEGYLSAPTPPDVLSEQEVTAVRAAEAALLSLSEQNPERVPAAEAAPLVTVICDAHDRLVTADTGLDPVRRATYLRSTLLLRRLFAEAQN